MESQQYARVTQAIEDLLDAAGGLLCELVEGHDEDEQALLAGKLDGWFSTYHSLRQRRRELSVACLALIKSGESAIPVE